MLISYKWLQSYFDEKLPAPEELAELITFSFAEVERIEKRGDGAMLDIKVLPDRACYALSHRGVAYEVSAITGYPRKEMNWPQPAIKNARPLSVKVAEPELCCRYMARVVEGVTQREQPWVREHLEAIGQRSVNPIVDGANLVMFDMGQPLHAFDADKVRGAIMVRCAKKGEKLTTLDNREVALDESVLVIADDEAPLAIAGIKGGKKAEVTAETCNLILESANFNAAHIRKTAERLGIKTEASKRFENRLSPALAEVGIRDFTAYLFEMDKKISASEIVDVRHSNILQNVRMLVTADSVSRTLGLSVSESELIGALTRLGIVVEKNRNKLILTPPLFRVDLAVPEDIAEEVGRIIGYDKIPPTLPPTSEKPVEIPKAFYYEWKVREALVRLGFSEVMTSSFSEQGEVSIEKPLAADKAYARPNLRDNFEKVLKANLLNAPLLGAGAVKMFEIGRVFAASGEHVALALGIAGPKQNPPAGGAGALEAAVKTVSGTLGAELKGESKSGVFEANLDAAFAKLPEPKAWDISLSKVKSQKFQLFSPYPFIVRDIALFVPPDTTSESVSTVVKQHAGELVVRGPDLFDAFSKGGRKSLAFRLVFQSHDRTLTDAEVNGVMGGVYAALTEKGWEVR